MPGSRRASVLLWLIRMKRQDGRPPEPDARLAHSVRQLQELEAELERHSGWSIRFGRTAVRLIGSLAFVNVQLALPGARIAWNLWGPAAYRFDPFPFGVLTMIVSLEGVLLAAFILLAQNHLSR